MCKKLKTVVITRLSYINWTYRFDVQHRYYNQTKKST